MNDCTAWPHCRGFSLIELLIAMTVVSILAAIALPAYQGYLQQGRRYEAQQQLLEQALALERIYTQQGRYPDTFVPPPSTDFTNSTTASKTLATTCSKPFRRRDNRMSAAL